MSGRVVPLLFDPACAQSEWHREIYRGVQRAAAAAHCSVQLAEHAEAAGIAAMPEPVILIGFSQHNLSGAAELLTGQGKRVILAGMDADSLSSPVSCVTHSRSRQTIQLIQYLHACGKKRIALVGVGRRSLNDLVRVDAALRYTAPLADPIENGDVYDWAASLEECLHSFLPAAEKYDAVICPNDYAALWLVRALKERGVRIPEDLYLASFANQAIGRYCSPSITSITMDYAAIGRYAFAIWQQLQTLTEQDLVCKLFAPSRLMVRKSTDFQPPPSCEERGGPWRQREGERDLFYNDPTIRRLMRIESCLSTHDELDMRIIDGILRGESYEALCDRLFIGHSPLHYRVSKLYRDADCGNRAEFEKLFHESYGAFSFTEDGPSGEG